MFDGPPTRAKGTLYGLAAVICWSAYNIGVAMGRADGFSVADLTLLRYLGAAIALTPWVMMQGGARTPIRWQQVLVLLGLAGPLFGVLYNIGMPLTRLSHAVVISPGFSMIVAFALSALALGRWPAARRIAGIAVLLAALVCVAADRAGTGGPSSTWRGDAIFVLTGTLYGSFAFLLGRWKVEAVRITWIISTASLVLILPAYLAFCTPTDHSALAWAVQFLLQGAMGGGWAVVFYALAIQHLGAGRAGIFPALIPVATVPLGLIAAHTLPSGLELTGMGLAALGMFLSLSD